MGIKLLYPLFAWPWRRFGIRVLRLNRVMYAAVLLNAVFGGYTLVGMGWHWGWWAALVFPGGAVLGRLVVFGICLLDAARASAESAPQPQKEPATHSGEGHPEQNK